MAALPDLCPIKATKENFKKNNNKLSLLSTLEYARTSENSSLDNLILCVWWLAFCVNLASQNTQLFKH